MNDLSARLEKLTPEQRALLGNMLRERAAPAAPQRIPALGAAVRRPSFAEERFFFLDRLAPGSALYTFGAHYRIDGPLDVAALGRALGEVIRRHEALRTRITESSGEPVQTVAAADGWAMEEIVALPLANRVAEAERIVARESRRVFDLAQDPLLHATLIRLGAEEHLLLLTVHHIAADGWSMDVIAREVSRLYGAFTRGEPSPLPPLPIQYGDFAAWQRAEGHGGALAGQLAYVRERLRGAPPLLDLPTDRPRPALPSLRSGREVLALPGPACAAAVALGKAQGATAFMTLLTAYVVLLHRYSGQDDLVVGTPVAARTRSETEGLVGLFINTLALRVDLSGDPSFVEVLRRVRTTVVEALAHQDVPFARLVQELAPARTLGVAPLFQAVFVLRDAPADPLRLDGATVTPLPFDNGTIDLDLSFELVETPVGMTGAMRYDVDLFDAATIRRLLAHYRAVLEAATASPDMPVSRLALLSEAERATLITEWNRTEVEYPRDRRVEALVLEQAARTPDAIAVSYAGEEVTYAALVARARAVAGRLSALPVAPGALVAIFLDRSPAMVAALLGTHLAGCAYVPIDPEYPPDRTAFVLADAGVAAVISEERLLDVLPQGEAPVLVVDRAPGSAGAFAPPPALTSSDLAYVIYTSGSTGRPKGVEITHRNVVNFLGTMARSPGLTASDVLVAVTTISFDIAGLELWLPLVTGARIEIADRATTTDGAALMALLERSGATIMQATPATWRMLVESGWRGREGFRALCGGEALGAELAEALCSRAARVFNLYGPTETTIWSTVQELDGSGVTIGKPIANTQTYVLDQHLAPVPIGVPGELYIGGDGVAVGYRRRPRLTAERFVPDPFGHAPGAKLYRTGDRARHRDGGTLEHLGRLDHQIKLRGYRIEPGEIEATLCRRPGIRDAAVIVRETTPGDARLCAYVVADRAPAVAELRRALAADLPAYMIPSAFVFLDRLPRTPNGKLDRRALPAPEQAPSPAAALFTTGEAPASVPQAFVAPETHYEQQLAAIWSGVLDVPRVSATQDFFDLGGHSLLAMRVLSRVRDAFGLAPSLRDLFRASTVRALARHLEGMTAAPDALPLGPRGDAPPALSFAQERFWFLERFEPGSPLYHIPAAVRLRGPLDEAALRRALDAIVARHEVLRTVLRSTDGSAEPAVLPRATVPVTVLSRPGLSLPDTLGLLTEQARVPFDLSADVMLRVTVIDRGDDDRAILFLFHHIAADGWSLGIFFRELSALYAAGSVLPALSLQYADYAVWQRRLLTGGALDAEVAYWKKQLAGAPPRLDLPVDLPRPTVLSVRGAARSLSLPRDLLDALHALGRRAGVTLFVTLLSAFEVLLHRLSGQADFCVGTPVAGRTRLSLEGLVGSFVNMLVLRADLADDPSFMDLATRVRETTLAAYAHQDVPFERLVEELAPARSTSYSPIFQVMFVLENAGRDKLSLGDAASEPLVVETGISKYDLTLWATEHEGGLDLQLEYATDLFFGETAAQILADLEGLLRAATRSPGDRVGSLPLAGDALPARRESRAPSQAPAPFPRAPRVMVGDALEAELVVMWQEVLNVRPVRIQDDFFTLGGHSLLAARLFDRIERRIGQRLPIAILFQAPTIEELAEVLRHRGWASSWSSLVPIQTMGTLPPLFFVHAVGGNILNYRLLSRHLGPDQPFYALQSQGLDGVHEPHDTVEEAAAHYVREIRAVQPHGPYHVGGSSSGGIMAFEVAQQLVAAGEEVGLLALIDTSLWYAVPIAGNVVKATSARRQLLRFDFHLGQLLLRRVRDWPGYLVERARAKTQMLLQPEHPDTPSDLLQHVWDKNHDAMARYVPQVFPGRVTMLLSQEEPHRAFADPRLAWSRVAAGGLVLRPIPGDHEHVLDEPIVGAVAAELRALLARTE